jgi:hypothetical protein
MVFTLFLLLTWQLNIQSCHAGPRIESGAGFGPASSAFLDSAKASLRAPLQFIPHLMRGGNDNVKVFNRWSNNIKRRHAAQSSAPRERLPNLTLGVSRHGGIRYLKLNSPLRIDNVAFDKIVLRFYLSSASHSRLCHQ